MDKESSIAALEVHDLTVSYSHRPVLWDIDFSVPAGKLVAVVGPNGAGKSTLIKSIMGLLPLSSGYVRIFGESLQRRRGIVSYVPQREEVDWDFPINVFDVVMMGRYGRLPFYRRPSDLDYQVAENSLKQVGMEQYSNRQISQLSGGQQQRVFIARALAQEAELYLMDEPFAGVDAATESALSALFCSLRDSGKTIVCVHHDLNTVAEFFDYVLLINVRLVAYGKAGEVLNAENLNATYGGRLGLLADVVEKLKSTEWKSRH